MNFIKSPITDEINAMQSAFYQRLTAPIDGMWELLYIASSQHYLIIDDDQQTIGYCCVNREGSLLQIALNEAYYAKMSVIINELVTSKRIRSASLSSKEALAFNACLYLAKSIKPNTFCYEHINEIMEIDSPFNLSIAGVEDIPLIKDFYREQIGMDDTFGYTENLVARNELFFFKEAGTIIATSECRLSDT